MLRINIREGGEIWNSILIILQSLLNIVLQNIPWIGPGKAKDISSFMFWEPAAVDILQVVARICSFQPRNSRRIVLTIVNQWDIISYHIVPYHIISYCIIFYRWDRIVKDFLEFTQTCKPPNISEKIRVSLDLVKLSRLQRNFSWNWFYRENVFFLNCHIPRLSRAIHSQLNGSSRLLFETQRDWQTEKLNIRLFVYCQLSLLEN